MAPCQIGNKRLFAITMIHNQVIGRVTQEFVLHKSDLPYKKSD